MFLRTNRGSALVQAMLITGMVASVAGIYAGQYRDAGKNSALARAQAQMMMVEGRLRYMAVHPTTYTCTTDVPTQTRQCVVNMGLLHAQELNLPNVPCPPGNAPCGIRIQNINNPGGGGADNPAPIPTAPGATKGQVYAEIVYTGTDVNVAKVKISDLFIPVDIASLSALCPDATPVFQGFDGAGNLECVALPKCNSPYSIALGVSAANMAMNCAPLNPNPVGCTPPNLIEKIYWDTSVNGFAVTCMPPLDPFAYYGFAPTLENINHVAPPIDSGSGPPPPPTTTTLPTTTTTPPTTLPPTTTTVASSWSSYCFTSGQSCSNVSAADWASLVGDVSSCGCIGGFDYDLVCQSGVIVTHQLPCYLLGGMCACR